MKKVFSWIGKQIANIVLSVLVVELVDRALDWIWPSDD